MSPLSAQAPADLLLSLADHTRDVIWSVTGTDFRLEYANPAIETVFGRPVQDFYANRRLWLEVVHPADRQRIARSHEHLIAHGRAERRYRILRPDGTEVWLHDQAWTVCDDAGNLLRICGMARDVTAEEARSRRARQQLMVHQSLFRSTNDAVFLVQVEADGCFRYLETNPAHQEKTGLALAAIKGKTPQEVLGLEQGEQVAARYRRCVTGGEPLVYEERLHLPSGVRDWLTQLVPIRDRAGAISLLVGQGRDITQIRDAERLLSKAQGELDRLLAASPAVVYAARPEPALPVTYFSPNLRRLLGYSRDQVLRREDWKQTAVHPADRQAVSERLQSLLRHGGSVEQRYRIRHADGRYLWVQDHMRLLRSASGEAQEVVGALIDISAQHELDQQVQKLGEQLPGLVYQYRRLADGRGWFPYASGKSLEIYGVPPSELRYSDAAAMAAVHPADQPGLTESVERSAAELTQWHHEFRVRLPSGDERWISARATPERLEDDSVLWHGYAFDVTAHKATQLALEESEARYRQIAENITDLVCLHDPDGHYRFVSPSSRHILGYRPEELVGRSGYELIHPEDRERIRSTAHQKALAGRAGVSIEYRMRQRDGGYLWLETRTKPLLAPDGRVIALQTISRDVTERRAAQDALKALAQRQERILEAAGEGIYGVDVEGRITFLNPAAGTMLGWRPMEVMGRRAHPLFHARGEDGEPCAQEQCPVHQAMAEGHSRRVRDAWFWRRDGSGFPVELVASPVFEGGQVAGCVVVFQDITERRKSQAMLEQPATTDTLTGAPNRRYFLSRLEQELQRVARHGGSAGLVMFDGDHFKRVNDGWGHAAGDEVLRQLTRTCASLLRGSDLMGRLGGEEFAVLLPETDAEGALHFAERLRAAVAAMQVRWDGEVIPFTISLGVTELTADDSADSALERADKALYRAKAEGRNRSCLAD